MTRPAAVLHGRQLAWVQDVANHCARRRSNVGMSR
jgi:hypothetical protein